MIVEVAVVVGGTLCGLTVAGLWFAKWAIEREDHREHEARAADAAGDPPCIGTGTHARCPLCGASPPRWMPYAFFSEWANNEVPAEVCGPTMARAVQIGSKPYLKQGCLACRGEWLSLPNAAHREEQAR